MQKIFFLFSFFTLLGLSTATAQENAAINKRNKTLFDQTVDKVNFRTIEFVYDRKFPRKKFPASQSDFKTRKTFDDFEGNAAFKKLFLNYNDVSEKFKNKFGKNSYELAAFEKALNEILINKDFEFFISSLTKDDKIVLIRSLQQINKKGVAQFVDAAGKPRGFFASDSVIEESGDPIVKPKNAATATTAEATETGSEATITEGDSAEPVINTAATPEEVFQQKGPRRDWLSWLALLFSVAALALAAAVKLKDLPEVRSFVSNNFQKRGDAPAPLAVKAASGAEKTQDPTLKKQLDNLSREVEGLYAQMDELLHKNAVLEQKLAATHPKPFEVPKTAYLAPETEPETPAKAENRYKAAENKPKEPLPPTAKFDATPETPVSKQEPVAFTSFSLTQEPVAEAPVMDQPNLYLNKPDRHGFFWNDEVTRSFVPHQSLFVMTVSENDKRKALFQIIEDAAQQKLALENPELYLTPVCEVQVVNANGQRLETLSPGTIILNGDQWVLVKKATLQVV